LYSLKLTSNIDSNTPLIKWLETFVPKGTNTWDTTIQVKPHDPFDTKGLFG